MCPAISPNFHICSNNLSLSLMNFLILRNLWATNNDAIFSLQTVKCFISFQVLFHWPEFPRYLIIMTSNWKKKGYAWGSAVKHI